MNKLFCTFSTPELLDDTIESLRNKYDILYKKIFVFSSDNTKDYICSYNIEYGNIHKLLPFTISVHRKKKFNTIYTINALNLITKNNSDIEWNDYSNSILLTQKNVLKILPTKIEKIVQL